MMIGGSHAPTVKNEALSAKNEALKLRPFFLQNQGVSARPCPFCKFWAVRDRAPRALCSLSLSPSDERMALGRPLSHEPPLFSTAPIRKGRIMTAIRKFDWITLSCRAVRSDELAAATKSVARNRLALALAILLAGASCTGDAPPAQSSPTEGILPAAVLGTAAPLAGQPVSYYAGDDAAVGYLAVPEGEGPFPSLILIHEWNGLVDRIREVADAMAAEGYVTLAADLYSGQIGSTPAENGALMREHLADPDAMVANLDAAARFLRERDDVTGRVGTLGWCFGGGVALTYALGGEHHEATAIFYGSLVTDPAVLASIDHEVYGSFAEMDNGIPPETVNEFVSALRAAGVENDVHIYDAVNHGFWLRIDGNPELRTEPGLDAWQRLKGYLRRTLSD